MSDDDGRQVTFFGPHPGVGGAAIPLPVVVKRVADALDGQTLPLRSAVACLQAVAPGTVYADAAHGAILLRMGAAPPMHLWRVIRFR
ncbi:MAG TPA: hypothetical protein VLC10_04580 [Patescibacteria group bacterium]|nr:hypothetical protein [Patescibacteria group bacterium]